MENSELEWIWKMTLLNWHNLVTLGYQKILILKKIVLWVRRALVQVLRILQVWVLVRAQVQVLPITKIKKEPQIKNLNLKTVK